MDFFQCGAGALVLIRCIDWVFNDWRLVDIGRQRHKALGIKYYHYDRGEKIREPAPEGEFLSFILQRAKSKRGLLVTIARSAVAPVKTSTNISSISSSEFLVGEASNTCLVPAPRPGIQLGGCTIAVSYGVSRDSV